MSGTTNATWPGDMWQHGGAAAWLGGTYDPELDLLFFGTGQPAPWNSWLRPGDNLYSSSTLAIDPDDGEIKWHYQTTPHDGWDFDGVNEFIPFELEKDGQKIHAGAKADRNGFFFVLDRTDGRFISASPFVSKTTWAKGYGDDGRPLADPASRPKNPIESKAEGVEDDDDLQRPQLPRRQELDADGLQPEDRHVLRAQQRMGHGDLERGHQLQEGCRLSRRRLQHQAALRGSHRRAARDRPGDRPDQVRGQQQVRRSGAAS